ncbi:hypothetical protein THASP1DRAFT_33119, partial [Thamnocephalis sphaerospora]
MHPNATSAADTSKRYLIFHELQRLDLDGLIITETWWKKEDEEAARWDDEVKDNFQVFTSGAGNQFRGRGVAVVLANSWARYVQEVRQLEGRMVGVRLAFRGRGLLLVGVLHPTNAGVSHNEECEKVERTLRAWIREAEERRAEVLIGGDFNSVSRPAMDRSRARSNRPSSQLLRYLLLEARMRDVWRDRFTDARAYTNVQRTGRGESKARLDMFLVSPMLAVHTTGVGIADDEVDEDDELSMPSEVRSSHRAIYVELTTQQLFPRGPVEVAGEERTLFRTADLSEERWAAYTEATAEDMPREMRRAVAEVAESGALRHTTMQRLARLWKKTTEHLLKCAEKKLPSIRLKKRKPGQPPPLTPQLQAVRAVARLLKRDAPEANKGQRLEAIARRLGTVATLQEAA